MPKKIRDSDVVDRNLNREGLLVFLGHRVQGLGHRDVDQGRDHASVNGAAGVEMPLLGLQANDGAALLGARQLGPHHFRKATILAHRVSLPPRKDF